MKRRERVTITCGFCGSQFQRLPCQLTLGYGKFCSTKCRNAAARTKKQITCSGCGKSFERHICELDAEKSFCSRDCYFANRDHGKAYKKVGARHLHRVVAEQVINRPLKSGEIVHHVDGDKRNNAPENLQVLPSQSVHAKMHLVGNRFTSP